jgi:lipoyl(octanoyl) transferase
MALDHALLRRAAATGESVLRIYSWETPTLSLGRHQPARGLYDLAAIRSAGLDVVRRPTGGRAVLHHHEVTYSVTAQLPRKGSLDRVRAREVYFAINDLLVEGLRRLGVPAGLTRPDLLRRAPRPSEHPCFSAATDGEVVVGGRKLIGSAQWRDPDAMLQHGSVLIADDQNLLASLSLAPLDFAPVATLTEQLGRSPSVGELAAALREALDEALRRSGSEVSGEYPDDEATRAAAQVFRRQYTDDTWTWRR